MKYTQKQMTTGAWVDKNILTNGQTAKIVSEAKQIESRFKDEDGNLQMQDVAKVHYEGQHEPVNTNLNRATIAGLIEAFGDDSVNWQGHPLVVETEKMRVAGKAVTALYLIPDGFKKIDDENGYAVIVKKQFINNTTVEYPEGPKEAPKF